MAKQAKIEQFASICTIKDGILYTPTIYVRKSNGKIQSWVAKVELWESTKVIPIEPKHITGFDSVSYFAKFYSKFEQIDTENKTKWSTPTDIMQGTNLGKKNETTALTQAIFRAMSRYNNNINKKGYVTKIPKIISPNPTFEELMKREQENPWRVFPQKIHNFRKFAHKIDDEFYIERKMDGIFATFVYHPDDFIDGFFITKKTIPSCENIKKELSILKNYPGLYICGELYIHGSPLQSISGLARKDNDNPKNLLHYYVFDCFRTDKIQTYEERIKILDKVFENIEGKYIHPIEREITNKEDYEEIFNSYISEGYEGAVIRNLSGIYKFGLHGQLRSYDVQKLKIRDDAEWECVDFTQGRNGKEAGAIIYICRAGNKLFNVTPNQPYDERYELFKKMCIIEENQKTHFENNYKGKKYKVNYSILSKDGVPQQPKGLGFRFI